MPDVPLDGYPYWRDLSGNGMGVVDIPETGCIENVVQNTELTAVQGQITFYAPFSYTPGFVSVHVNGVLLSEQEYSAHDGSTIVLVEPVQEGDIVVIDSILGGSTTADTSNQLFIQAGTGAVERNAQDKMRERVSVADFGAVGNYNPATGFGTDDGPAINAAILSLNGAGVVHIAQNKRYYVATTINLPDGVVLECDYAISGAVSPPIMATKGGTLYLSPAITIMASNGAGLRNINIFRAGLAFTRTSAQVAATFLGTAVTLKANTSDHVFEHVVVLGFLYGIKSQDTTTVGSTVSNSRAHFNDVRMDNINCIWIHNCYDILRIKSVHCWPYLSIGAPAEANSAQLKRTGTALKLTGVNDWTMVLNLFTFGYSRGAEVVDGASVTFVNCGHDHPAGSTDGSIGFLFSGDARECRVIGGQVAGKEYGIYVNSTWDSSRLSVSISAPNIWVTTTAAIHIEQGYVSVVGGALRNPSLNAFGVRTSATTGLVSIVGTDFRGFSQAINNFSSSIPLYYSSCTFSGLNTVVIGNPYIPTIASAASPTLQPETHNYIVTGVVPIGNFGAASRFTGRPPVTLIAGVGAAFNVVSSATLRLKDNANYAMVEGDTLTIASSGTAWVEVARASVNPWITTFVPTVVSTTGAITTSSASCEYKVDGAMVHFSMLINITTNGTGAGAITATLPFARAAGSRSAFAGRNVGVGGKMVSGSLSPSSNNMAVQNYDNSYPGVDGSIIAISGSYRTV